MPLLKRLSVCVLAAVGLSACGSTAKPVAGSIPANAPSAGHAQVDDARDMHIPCLQQHHLQAVKRGQTDLLIGTAPGDPTVTFVPTPGAAQGMQISGQATGAEVIGSALLYPHEASDRELQVIEDCLAAGVQG
jgi:hypothetical protein